MRVLTGMSNVFRIRELPFNPVERYIVHHEYTPDEVYNDIAVVKVSFEFSLREKSSSQDESNKKFIFRFKTDLHTVTHETKSKLCYQVLWKVIKL